jgi:hypothetical protein
MTRRSSGRALAAASTGLAVVFALGAILHAQQRGQGTAPAPATPRTQASIDLTGYWVAVVTEDWRWRMVTPPKGDVSSVPINAAGRKVADSWDPSTDGSCLAYGAGGLMRIPTRLHITWEGDNVLKVDTDAGTQTRRLMFNNGTPPGPRSMQGYSRAAWEGPGGAPPGGRGGRGAAGAGGGAPNAGSLKVVTNNLTPGWLRKNGVPYSQNAVVTEYFYIFTVPNGDRWLVVSTVVDDPMYLNQPFVTSTNFRMEADGASKWAPTACKPTRS